MDHVDRRRVDALLLQVDALARELAERKEQDIVSALAELNRALETMHEALEKRALYLTLPADYKPPFRGAPKGK
jgi:ABC-type transporter Mla subunit MlaD